MRVLELLIPPPAVVCVMAALMWLVSRPASSFGFVVPAHSILALILVVGGFLTGISGVVTFRRAKTTVNPTKPQSSSSLVTWNIYTITRNPMYLGGLIMLTGWTIHLSNVLAFLFLPIYIIYINRFQIEPEERALTSLFGQEYAAYQSRLRRWI